MLWAGTGLEKDCRQGVARVGKIKVTLERRSEGDNKVSWLSNGHPREQSKANTQRQKYSLYLWETKDRCG